MFNDIFLGAGACLLIIMAVLFILALGKLRRFSTDPQAPRTFRKLLVLSAATAALGAFTIFIMPKAYNQMIIEPVGGVAITTASDSSRQRQRPQDTTPSTEPTEAVTPPADNAPPSPDQSASVDDTWATGSGPLTSALRTNRVIIHTADTTIVVRDIPAAINRIEGITAALGGWLVNSHQDSNHNGSASIKVPATSLNQAINEIGQIATSIRSINLSSQDLTDEFIDTGSKLRVLEATEKNYLNLLTQAKDVNQNLIIHKHLLEIQKEMEQLKGRISYLSEASAFSLINITLNLAPVHMAVDAGADITIQTGQEVFVDAILASPKGSDLHQYNWDFGDGTPPVTGQRTALLVGGAGKRITNPARHLYKQEGRHIIEINAIATGLAGVAEGNDTIIVTVKAVPSITVSVPADRFTVTENETLKVKASFTTPQELQQYTYQWDWGDATPTQMGSLPDGINQIIGNHTYANPTQSTLTGFLTLSALSEAGKISSTQTFTINVRKSKSIIAGNWDVAGWFKNSARAVFAVLSIILMATVWILIFSPLIAIGAGAIFLMYRKGWIGTQH